MAENRRIRIGVGGWTFPPWRGVFYPDDLTQKRELEYASRELTSIEVNGTYYGTIRRDSFRVWRDQTPDGFVFSLKAPRFATNRRKLAEAGPSIARFLDSGVLDLGDKLGPINWQFLPTKAFDPDDFEAFLSLLPKRIDGRPMRHAVEVRHASFACPAFVSLLRRYGIAIATDADSKFPVIPDVTADFVYARIRGTTPSRRAGYTPRALDLWAKRARQWSAGEPPEGLSPIADPPVKKSARDVFLYVIAGYKPHNPAAAMQLIRRIGQQETA